MAEKRHFTAQIIKRNILGNIFVSLFRSVIFMITKGAKVTRSTSAYALPLFLPRPENSKQKAPVQGKNNPEIPFPAPF